jgi:hypothetical protein
VLFGAAMMVAPRPIAAVWVGPRRAARPEVVVLGRALGARDLALGVATLAAFGDSSARPPHIAAPRWRPAR